MTDLPSHNRSLVRRGKILFAHEFLNLCLDVEIEDINDKRKAESTGILIRLFLLLAAPELPSSTIHTNCCNCKETKGPARASQLFTNQQKVDNIGIDGSRSNSE